MAWSAPRTWTDGEVVTGTLFNQEIRDNQNVLGTHDHSGGSGLGSTALGSLNSITFANQGTSPTVTGRLQRNATGLEFYTGAVTVIMAPNAGAGTPSPRSLGTTGITAASGTHVHALAAGSATSTLNGAQVSLGEVMGTAVSSGIAGFMNAFTVDVPYTAPARIVGFLITGGVPVSRNVRLAIDGTAIATTGSGGTSIILRGSIEKTTGTSVTVAFQIDDAGTVYTQKNVGLAGLAVQL